MGTSKKLLAAYDDAMVVMSGRCRFVEWKVYGGGEDVTTWSPFGPSPEKKEAFRKIKGERWVYVFRRFARTRSAGVWVDELHLVGDRIEATPMDKAIKKDTPVERERRPDPVDIGDTISFARRVNGVAMEYYFFSSRIRLPAGSIQAIGPKIAAYAPPVNFEEDDRNLAGKEGGALLVPVLDPITIALHLHAYYVAAANDIVDYTTEHKDQSGDKQEKVRRRQQKHLLAQLIAGLVDKKVDSNGELQSRLDSNETNHKNQPRYLDEYDAQLQHRVRWRDRWAGWLSRWLKSETMKILAEAHEYKAKEDFHKFLIPYCKCVTRLGESSAGKDLLDDLAAQKDHWIHKYILITEEPKSKSDQFQVIRKGGGAVFEALKEWGPRIILAPAKYRKIQFTQTFNWLAGETVISPAKATIKVQGEVVVYSAARGPRVVQITEVNALVKDAEIAPKWEGAAKKVGVIVEAVNTVLAIKQMIDAMAGDSPGEKAVAITNLIGSGLDVSVAILQFTKVRVRTLGAIGFVSGVIDTVLAIKDTYEAYTKNDMGGMVGGGVVALGSALGVGAGLGLITGSAFAGPLAVAALAVVALGYSIKLLLGNNDTPYHLLVAHCEWGRDAGKGADQPDWAPAPYDEWKGKYPVQLAAAVNVLCSLSIEKNDLWDPRQALVKMAWVPTGARLTFWYREVWSIAGKNRVLVSMFTFNPSGPVAVSPLLTIKALGTEGYVVRPRKTADEPDVVERHWTQLPKKVDGLYKIAVEVQLEFELFSTRYVIPNKKAHEQTLLSDDAPAWITGG